MCNFIAYIIAIFTLYRKQLFVLFLLLLSVLILLPLVKKTELKIVETNSGGQTNVAAYSYSKTMVGQEFVSLADLKSAEAASGFVPTGYFGNHWPARVAEVLTANDSISFARQGGTKHTYRVFGGYRMKVVRLLTARQQETIIVFRSIEKSDINSTGYKAK